MHAKRSPCGTSSFTEILDRSRRKDRHCRCVAFAGGRFRARVEAAEALAAAEGLDFRVLGLDEQDGYYRRAKTDLEKR